MLGAASLDLQLVNGLCSSTSKDAGHNSDDCNNINTSRLSEGHGASSRMDTTVAGWQVRRAWLVSTMMPVSIACTARAATLRRSLSRS